MAGGTIVVGIGNPSRGDDGVGPAVAERLRSAMPEGLVIVTHDGEAASLLDCIAGAGAVIFVDACVSGAPPGTVRRVDVHAEALPELRFGLSTHGFGLGEAIALGKALGSLPPACVIYAVEAAGFDTGASLSAPVAAAVKQVAAAIRSEVAEHA